MKVIYLLKAILLFFGMMFIALLVIVFGIPWWGSSKLNWVFIQTFSRFTSGLIGVKKVVIDQHKAFLCRPAVFIGNHQSALDFAFIGSVTPNYSVVVGKREIIYIPIICLYFKIAGNILIDRSNHQDSHKQINLLANTLVKKNLVVSIFPEGTRNKKSNETLLPFKKGAFHIAFAKQLPISPVVCSSLQGIAVWERLELAGGKVMMKILDPIETKGIPMSEMNSFIEKIRNLMQSELTILNAQLKSEGC